MNLRPTNFWWILLALLSAGECPAATGQTVRLTWTAPGDDGTTGRAQRYDIRYSTAPITPANFDRALRISTCIPCAPKPAGSEESFVVNVFPGHDHFFAIRTSDDAGNRSFISNVVHLDPRLEVPGGVDEAVSLSAPWPNPARRSARVALVLAQARHCRVEIFDGQGRRVRLLADHVLAPGRSELTWDLLTDRGDRVASGMYFMRANVGTWDQLRRVVVTG